MDIRDIAKSAEVSLYSARNYGTLFYGMTFENNRQQYSVGVSGKLIKTIKKWKSGAEIVKELGISRQWLYELRTQHNLPCKRFTPKTIYYELEVVRERVKKLQKLDE